MSARELKSHGTITRCSYFTGRVREEKNLHWGGISVNVSLLIAYPNPKRRFPKQGTLKGQFTQFTEILPHISLLAHILNNSTATCVVH